MKTIRFDCNGHNAPAYGCNRPGDNSGEYVPAAVAQGLYDALNDSRRTIDALIGDGYVGYVDFRSRIDAALAAADGEDV